MELIWRDGDDVSPLPYGPLISPYAHFWLTQILTAENGAISDMSRQSEIVGLSTELRAGIDDLIDRAFQS